MNELSGAERFEQLSEENKARYLAINRQMVRLARDYAVPIIFAPPPSVGGKINGASGCVVRLASGRLLSLLPTFWRVMKSVWQKESGLTGKSATFLPSIRSRASSGGAVRRI